VNGVKVRTYPCGSARCSEQCRRRWERKLSACLRRGFEQRPPEVTVRLTAFGWDDATVSKAEGAFFRRLKYRKCEYCFVREWQPDGTGRHVHLAVRSNGRLTSAEVGKLWKDSLCRAAGRRDIDETHYAAEIRTHVGLARYLAKDVRGGGAVVPRSFRGRVFGSSRDFLPRPLKQLWAEVREGWFAKRRQEGGPSSGAEPPAAAAPLPPAPSSSSSPDIGVITRAGEHRLHRKQPTCTPPLAKGAVTRGAVEAQPLGGLGVDFGGRQILAARYPWPSLTGGFTGWRRRPRPRQRSPTPTADSGGPLRRLQGTGPMD
jgi:hypothetical protein